jgi:hypothetical protein
MEFGESSRILQISRMGDRIEDKHYSVKIISIDIQRNVKVHSVH